MKRLIKKIVRRKKKKSRFHKGIYKGMSLDSSWELAYVIWCEDQGKKIERNIKKFPYTFRNRIYNYIPDFIVDGSYVEVKGREVARTHAKYRYFPHPLTILRRKEMAPILKYVIQKHGINFYDKLYNK